MTALDCTGSWDTSPPIGRPIAGHTTYVVDDQLNPAPPGTPGELLVGGPGLPHGYLGRPGLTASSFVPNPFGDSQGARLCRTGGLVQELPSGDLRFLSRKDRQTKINGVRIELGEFESAMAALDGVAQAYVRSVPDRR